jgi:serine/threonine-protein kinase
MDVARKKGRAIPLPAALRIAREVLDRLDRDRPPASVDPRGGRAQTTEISPRTIFVNVRGDVSLCSIDGEGSPDDAGRIPYLAPEQVGGWKTDARCDVFSVGAVLYEMLTGMRLFHGSDLESLVRTYEADLSAIAEPTARLPLELRLILASALAREPDERFQEARDFADAIRSFADHTKLPLDRGELTAWLGSLDLWPAQSGMFAKSDLNRMDGFPDTPEDATSDEGRERRARQR